MTQIRNKQIKFDSNISFTSLLKLTSLANGTSANDAVNKSQLDAVSALIGSLEWKDSVLTSTVLNPVAETPIAGDRYLINGVGAGGFAGSDNKIATYVSGAVTSPASWSFYTPTTGAFVAADNLPEQLFLFGGSVWSAKSFEATTASDGLVKVGLDVRIDAASAFFIEASQDAAGSLATNSARVSLTYNDGANTLTADLVAASITEGYMAGLGVGTGGQVLTSNGTGGFVWATTAAVITQARTINSSAATSPAGANQLSVTDVFGAFDPISGTIPKVSINGSDVNPALNDAARAASACYFGTVAGTAVALNALDGTENFYVNGSILGYALDASDTITVHFTV